MRLTGSRVLKVKTQDVIDALTKNMANHQKEYVAAVAAYKVEAEKQLKKRLKDLREGSLKIELKLTHPEDRTEDYKKIIKMFELEVEDVIDLDQDEFNQYIHDELTFAKSAKMSNSFYVGG